MSRETQPTEAGRPQYSAPAPMPPHIQAQPFYAVYGAPSAVYSHGPPPQANGAPENAKHLIYRSYPPHPPASAPVGAPASMPPPGNRTFLAPQPGAGKPLLSTVTVTHAPAPNHGPPDPAPSSSSSTAPAPYQGPPSQTPASSAPTYGPPAPGQESWGSHPPPHYAPAPLPPGLTYIHLEAHPPPHGAYAPWHHHHHHAPPPHSYGAPPPGYWTSAQPPPPPPPPPAPSQTSSHVVPPPKQRAVERPSGSPNIAPKTTQPKPYEHAQYNNAVETCDGRPRASSPSQIENHHRDEIQNMGCTCKKTRCLKLYCQCFGAKLYCGVNCRCLTCHNNQNHEKIRREAMSAILMRNPSAFDTKFKKAADAIAIPSSPEETGKTVNALTESEANRILAHKLGCKCRKSACMKKYCECYAGNVKCTGSCRCMGCKNMAPNTSAASIENERARLVATLAEESRSISQHPPYNNQHMQPPLQAVSNGSSDGIGQGKHGAEPWLAAQNLTFMKHGSPSSEKQSLQRPSYEGDIPSLASSSEGTSPGDAVKLRDKADEEGARALLFAAMAMTEFGQSTPSKKRALGENKNGSKAAKKVARA